MKLSAVFLLGAAVTMFLIPNERITSLKQRWEPARWAQVMSNNHDTISMCYGHLEDKNYKDFIQLCNVTHLLETENLVMTSFAQARTKYPQLSQTQFLLQYFDNKTTIIISSHLNISKEFRMTLMILMIAEPLVPLYV